MVFIPLAPSFWLSTSQLTWLFILPTNIINLQLNRTAGRKLLGWNTSVTSIFNLFIISNLIGLVPYVFSTSRHLIFTLSFGLTIWLALILSSLTNSPIIFLASLLPGGAPSWLNPFLVTIETTSVTVRPSTLSFRLAANISAGHIVISLLGIYTATAFFTSLLATLLLLSTLVSYFLFEVGICFIQAFIFSLLLSIYSTEHT